MEKFKVMLAGHLIGIECRSVISRKYFSDYIVENSGEPELISRVTDEELDRTQKALPEVSREMAEITGLYRPIAEAMPEWGGFVFHGAAITFGEKAYIFTAPSGTGKSTHIRLWRQYLGDAVDIVNGDKPIITVDDSSVIVHGTPWAGKERWQKNRSAVLGGICLLHRSDECFAEAADMNKHLPFLFSQTYISKDADVTGRTMELLDAMLKTVPVYTLHCDISEDAVRCSFEALSGLCYDDHKARKD